MELVNKIIDAIFPLFLVLMILSCFNLGKIKKSEALRFIIIFVCSMLALRWVIITFAGIKVSSRYFYGLSFIAVCFSVPGLMLLTDWLKKIISIKSKSFSLKHSLIILLVLCSSICIGKGLRFKRNSKKWIFESAEIIRENSKGKRAILISNNPDRRAAYYADADFVGFLEVGTDRVKRFDKDGNIEDVVPNFGMLAKIGQKELTGKWILLLGSSGISDFEKVIRNIDGNVFVLMRMSDKEFRKKFSEEGIEFPLKLIKTIKDLKKREICLYVLKD